MPDTQMKYLDLTFPTPQKNLACDEALLDLCENGGGDELLRFWEPREYFVVLGYANKAQSEAKLEACREANLPVLRRCSGGGAVVQGAGCLNYSLFLRISQTGPLQSITETNCFIMKRQQEALQNLFGGQIKVQGVTDLSSFARADYTRVFECLTVRDACPDVGLEQPPIEAKGIVEGREARISFAGESPTPHKSKVSLTMSNSHASLCIYAAIMQVSCITDV